MFVIFWYPYQLSFFIVDWRAFVFLVKFDWTNISSHAQLTDNKS